MEKQIELLEASKKHWIEDIQKRFLAGETAYARFLSPRWSNGEKIKCSAEYCPLCREYVLQEGNCKRCPFIILLGKYCASAGGYKFCRNPSLETCNNFMANFDSMINKLGGFE